ncbi:MAG: hypothetical protein ISR78_04700 [Spirochaetia bacterium]|nr:hypothetical protein [Spirochaetia bacterium]
MNEQEYYNETGKKAYETIKTGKKHKVVYTTRYRLWLAQKEGRKVRTELLRIV